MYHPDHDRLILELPKWYQRSSSEMGYETEERKFGFYSKNTKTDHHKTSRVSIKRLSSAQIAEFISDIKQYYGAASVQIYIDNHGIDSEIGEALESGGCIKGKADVYLAHVGPIPEVTPLPGLVTEKVDLKTISEYSRTKLMGFSGSEMEPDNTVLESEISLRQAELEGIGRFLLARINSEGAGIIGYYIQRDYLIFQLATRIPFRRRGIAKRLVTSVLNDAYKHGDGAVIINADPTDTPVEIYHQLGFTDEVYWRQGYKYQPNRA